MESGMNPLTHWLAGYTDHPYVGAIVVSEASLHSDYGGIRPR
jgi:hypothetical protein